MVGIPNAGNRITKKLLATRSRKNRERKPFNWKPTGMEVLILVETKYGDGPSLDSDRNKENEFAKKRSSLRLPLKRTGEPDLIQTGSE